MSLRDRIHQDVKDAMKAQDKPTLSALRLITAAIKQIEVDQRITLDDPAVIALLDKLAKQRRESITQFQVAQRPDLVEQENFELTLIQKYLPAPLTDTELTQLIQHTIEAVQATSMNDMSRVMAQLKPQVQGRCDMAQVSGRIKALLQ